MKKIVLGVLALFFLAACDSEYVSEYNNETFTLGNSLTYEMPILESEMLQPDSRDLSTDVSTHKYNSYSFLDEDNLLSEVTVEYKLTPLNAEYIPYYYVPEEEMMVNLSETEPDQETVEVNGRQWIHVEGEPNYFESDGQKQAIIHDYYYRSSFEVYKYSFHLIADEKEFDNSEKVENSKKRMEEILSMAEFTHEPTKSEADILGLLNGTWESNDAGYLQFADKELKWYKDANMEDDNVLLIDLAEVTPLIHPEEDTEYAHLKLNYLTETIDGQTYDSDQTVTLFVNFLNEDKIVLIDMENAFQYILDRVK